MAFRIAGCEAIPCTPITPIAANHRAMTGPNSRPTAPVPSRCSTNRATMITAVIGTTSSATDGAATLTPSIAESTEIAGVMMLSPKNSEAPKIPSAASTAFARGPAPADQRDERHDPALTVIVRAHHQQDVGDRDDDRHGPEDQRDDPEHGLPG